MSPLSPLPTVACVLVAILSTFVLQKLRGTLPEPGRFATIDGLRGYLALLVFLSHSSIWYFFLRTGQWRDPDSNLYTHFGQSSVAIFFMITSFLFFTKLLDNRYKGVDWLRLFVSRITRLFPLYLALMASLFAVIAGVTHGFAEVSATQLLIKTLQWLTFTIFGAPSFAGAGQTAALVAGSVWSLPYEWLFYFSLPLLALLTRRAPPLAVILISACAIGVFATRHFQLPILAAFLGGICAAYLVRVDRFRSFSETQLASAIAISCIATTVAFFPTARSALPIVLLSISFSLIAAGASLFGVLQWPVSRALGEWTYSLYLLHLLLLFLVFHFVIGFDVAKTLTPLAHWSVIAVTTPALVVISYLSFRWVEKPGMQQTDAITCWLRKSLRLTNKKAHV